VFNQGGMHPGMRAAAEMKKATATQQSQMGGRGMMGVVLPMYAVGIVIYLIYTLAKVSLLHGLTNKDSFSTPVAIDIKSMGSVVEGMILWR